MMIFTSKQKDLLIDGMKIVLRKYGYKYTDYALEKIVDTWIENKRELLNAFSKHPNYVPGKYYIAFNSDYEREIDTEAVMRFFDFIDCNTYKIAIHFADEIKEIAEHEGVTVPYSINHFINRMSYSNRQFVEYNDLAYFNSISEELRITEGQKMSRAVNKVMRYLGADKLEDYNREFAKYSDALNPIKVKRHTVLSLNPIDYLLMSNGNSWTSCHTVNKFKVDEDGYHGCNSSGTMSYLLDESSFVFYTIDAKYDGENNELEPKISRQMFHYANEKLLQSRLYPQRNDGVGKQYETIREIVQKVVSDSFGFNNLWKKEMVDRNDILSAGTHYEDYFYHEKCNISYLKGSINKCEISIGHTPICIECGEMHFKKDCINHCNFPLREACTDSNISDNEEEGKDFEF